MINSNHIHELCSKRLIITIVSFLLLASTVAVSAQERAILSADFSGGSLGDIHVNEVVTCEVDHIPYRNIIVSGKIDPQNKFDSTKHRSNRWFYFKLSDICGDSVRLTLKGSDCLRPFYSYDNIKFNRLDSSEFNKGVLSKRFMTDSVYIAYFAPYTYERMQRQIVRWKEYGDSMTVDTIGYSEEGRPLQLLQITNRQVFDKGKKIVWINSRTHPGESPASFLMDGIIDRLLEKENDHLLRETVFYVIPMENPDGVANGLSRCDVLGVDHEGNYDSDSTQTAKEVSIYKDYIRKMFEERKPIDLFLNLHTQVARKSSFWIHTSESSSLEVYRNKLLLYYSTIFCTPMSVGDSDYNVRRNRVPEGWFLKEFGSRTTAVTLEVPYAYYGTPDQWVTEDNLRTFGSGVVDASAILLGSDTFNIILMDEEYAIAHRSFHKKYLAPLADEPLVYGDSYLQASKKSKEVSYLSPLLEIGSYKLYRWESECIDDDKRIASEKNREQPTNNWMLIDEFSVTEPKRVEVNLKSESVTQVFDVLLLQRQLVYD